MTKYTHEWRFREQDGSWSQWYVCTAQDAADKDGDPDMDVREREDIDHD